MERKRLVSRQVSVFELSELSCPGLQQFMLGGVTIPGCRELQEARLSSQNWIRPATRLRRYMPRLGPRPMRRRAGTTNVLFYSGANSHRATTRISPGCKVLNERLPQR